MRQIHEKISEGRKHNGNYSDLRWIEGAGHNSNTDKPEEINRLIDEFLHLADN